MSFVQDSILSNKTQILSLEPDSMITKKISLKMKTNLLHIHIYVFVVIYRTICNLSCDRVRADENSHAISLNINCIKDNSPIEICQEDDFSDCCRHGIISPSNVQ